MTPFHWAVEFPEVFVRENPGFDAIVGNPPFAGKNTIIAGNRAHYLPWLQTLHAGAHGNADLVAHFYRRAFGLLRKGGAFGLIATNTTGQGDTRATGLAAIIGEGGVIARATRRLKWPGQAAVVVSVVHVRKCKPAVMAGLVPAIHESADRHRKEDVDARDKHGHDERMKPILDGHQVRRISAYLVEGDLDRAPARLAANARKAFQGSKIYGQGFTFDDNGVADDSTESLKKMSALIAASASNQERIFPYIGGEEVNNEPRLKHDRYVIDFADFPLRRERLLPSWLEANDRQRATWLRGGHVPSDYPSSVASDWPDLLQIAERRVKPERDAQNREARKNVGGASETANLDCIGRSKTDRLSW